MNCKTCQTGAKRISTPENGERSAFAFPAEGTNQ